jgi:hypothetical protein
MHLDWNNRGERKDKKRKEKKRKDIESCKFKIEMAA